MPYPSSGALGAGFVVLVVLASVEPAQAAATAASEIVIVTQGDTVPEDLYAAGVRIIIEGGVEGDLVAFAAEEIVISGEVTGSVLAVAPTVTIDGDVGGSVRMSGNTLRLSGSVGADVVGAALDAELDSGSEVTGDVIIWSIDLGATGAIGADLSGSQRHLELAGTVGGDVDVSVNHLTISGPLEVGGDLGYRSSAEARGLDQASVGGVVVHKSPLPPNIRVRALGILTRFLTVLGLTSAALLVGWAWPKRTRLAGEGARARTLRAFAYGTVIVLSPLLLAGAAALIAGLVPAAASLPLLAIFVPLVVALMGTVLVLSLVAGVPAVLALGEALPWDLGLFGSILAGSILTGAVWLIPVVGWLVPLLVLPIGLGGWMMSFRMEVEPVEA